MSSCSRTSWFTSATLLCLNITELHFEPTNMSIKLLKQKFCGGAYPAKIPTHLTQSEVECTSGYSCWGRTHSDLLMCPELQPTIFIWFSGNKEPTGSSRRGIHLPSEALSGSKQHSGTQATLQYSPPIPHQHFKQIASWPSALLLPRAWLTNTARRSTHIGISKGYLPRAGSTDRQPQSAVCYLSGDKQTVRLS